MSKKTRRARLDADRTAKPMTKLVAHIHPLREGACIGPATHDAVLYYQLVDVDPAQGAKDPT